MVLELHLIELYVVHSSCEELEVDSWLDAGGWRMFLKGFSKRTIIKFYIFLLVLNNVIKYFYGKANIC